MNRDPDFLFTDFVNDAMKLIVLATFFAALIYGLGVMTW